MSVDADVESRYCERRLQIADFKMHTTDRARQHETVLSSEDQALIRNISVESGVRYYIAHGLNAH
jgi:hypothetical protein